MTDQSRFSAWKRAIVIALLAQFASFIMFPAAFWIPPSDRFLKQFEPLTHNPWSKEVTFEPQTRHRILGPAIAHYLGIRGYAAIFIPIIGGTLMLIFTWLVMRQHADEQWATWTTFLVATTLTLISSQTWFGLQDAIGGAAVAACFLVRRAWIAAIILFIGMLAEERCSAAIPFIALWHADDILPFAWKKAIGWFLALVCAVGLWVAYFYYANHHFLPSGAKPFQMGGAGFRVAINNIVSLPLAGFESIRGGWIVTAYAGFLLLREGKWLVVLGCLAGIAACLFQAAMIADISRSASVVWPVILLAVRVMYRSNTTHAFFLLKAMVFFNLLSPCYQVLGRVFPTDPPYVLQPYFPIPVSLTRWLLGI